MPPGVGSFYQCGRIGHPVHIAHFRMTVQFHSFYRAGIHPAGGKIRYFFDADDGTDGQFMVKFIHDGDAFDFYKSAFFDLFRRFRHLSVWEKHFHCDGVGKVCDVEHENGLFIADFPGIHRQDLSPDHHISHFSGNAVNGDGSVFLKISSVDHIRIGAAADTRTGLPSAEGFILCLLFFPVFTGFPGGLFFLRLLRGTFDLFHGRLFSGSIGRLLKVAGLLLNFLFAVDPGAAFLCLYIFHRNLQGKVAPFAKYLVQNPLQLFPPLPGNHRVRQRDPQRLLPFKLQFSLDQQIIEHSAVFL